jgi:hypothetical protein
MQLPHHQQRLQAAEHQQKQQGGSSSWSSHGLKGRRGGREGRFQQQEGWLRQRRLRRWLQMPTADWSAADWSFDDTGDDVTVLELVLGSERVAAVALRDNNQPARPIKVGRQQASGGWRHQAAAVTAVCVRCSWLACCRVVGGG